MKKRRKTQTVICPSGVVLNLSDEGNRRHVNITINKAFTEREITKAELQSASAWLLAEGFLEQVAGLKFNGREEIQAWINSL